VSGRLIGGHTGIMDLEGTDIEPDINDYEGALLFVEDIPEFFDEEGVEPSGGEQQKIAIARALYKDSPVVILDEPTAALDPIAEYEIYRQFNTLVGGKSAFYISHRLSSCQFCDRIAVFSDGRIAEYGTHAELENIPDGIYAKMFEAQAKYYKD
ncbi:MAG: ATP-binding cassette domain-containing protein, partial [Lachnospiraceae bacterium]|nr:ATP-binding cassette domain-containing protein [Lachnospiraceae bacterium]